MQDHLSAPQWPRWKIFYFPEHQSNSLQGKQYPHHYSVASFQLRRIIPRSEVNHPPGHFDTLLACSPPLLLSFHIGRTIYVIHIGVDTRLGGLRYSRCRLKPHGIDVMTVRSGYFDKSKWT